MQVDVHWTTSILIIYLFIFVLFIYLFSNIKMGIKPMESAMVAACSVLSAALSHREH